MPQVIINCVIVIAIFIAYVIVIVMHMYGLKMILTIIWTIILYIHHHRIIIIIVISVIIIPRSHFAQVAMMKILHREPW